MEIVLLNLNRRRAGLILILLSGVVAITLCVKPGRPPSIVLLPENTRVSSKDSLVPGSWAWYWRAKEFVFGKPSAVAIGITMIDIEGASQARDTALPAVVKTATNLQIYFVRTNDVVKTRNALAASQSASGEYGASITTAERTRARVVMGGGRPSFSIDVLAKRRGHHTDLLASIQATALGASGPLATRDLTVTTRLQIPKDHAAFILKSYPSDSALVGVIFTPQWK